MQHPRPYLYQPLSVLHSYLYLYMINTLNTINYSIYSQYAAILLCLIATLASRFRRM
jgi:hypothetical protein